MKSGLYHLYKRKRKYQKLEKYPNPKKWIKFLDDIVLIAAIIGPLIIIPQITKIFLLKDATGVSILTWSIFALISIPWIIYGVVHKEKSIIIMNVMFLIFESIVILGVLLYG